MNCPQCGAQVMSVEIVPRGQRIVDRSPILGFQRSVDGPRKYHVTRVYAFHRCGIATRRVKVARRKTPRGR